MNLTDHIDGSPQNPTACTDGKSIRWNPEFLAGLTDEETRFILIHETMHCAHHHLWRLPPNAQANEACDYAINATLAALPGLKMPKGGLLNAKYDGMAEEEIYAELTSRQKQKQPQPGQQGDDGSQGDDDGQDPGGCGGFSAPAPDGTPGDQGDPENQLPGSGEGGNQPADSLRDQWERAVIQADQTARALGQGSAPADMQRILEKVRHQPIDWRREMADFVRDAAATRNDWSRSARRHAWQSVIYPRRRADDIGLILAARDTSGSIDATLCAEFSALISSAIAETGCRCILVDCDADIQARYDIGPGEEAPLTAEGGGGTAFQPVFDLAAELIEQGERLAGIVYLTDLCGPEPTETDTPTLWLSTTSKQGPFGRTVRIER